jgi:ABC-2 type transport system ATP-binding protein
MRSGHAVRAVAPVLAAGVGVRYAAGWAIRSASFRLDHDRLDFDAAIPDETTRGASLGIAASRPASSCALIDLLAGRGAPDYGSLYVLGQDMSTAKGRSQVRRQVGIARSSAMPWAAFRIRGLVEHAARLACQPGNQRHLLAAAILDRLELTGWADVPVRSAPEVIVRKARLAAAAVHQPRLLLIDGLLDNLPAADRALLVDVIHTLERDATVIATGRSPEVLTQACREVLVLADGILIDGRAPSRPPWPPGSAADDQPAPVEFAAAPVVIGCRTWTGACTAADAPGTSPTLPTSPN